MEVTFHVASGERLLQTSLRNAETSASNQRMERAGA